MESDRLPCIQRTFQYSYIRWKITKFALLVCPNEFVLHSSEFSVNYPEVTMWRLGLKSTNARPVGDLSICLERLETEDGPETVWVNWKVGILNRKQEICFSTECEAEFGKKYQIEMDLLGFPEIDSIITDDCPDTLELVCDLIVDHRPRDRRLRSVDISIGLQSLSQDLKRLFNRSSYYDVVFKCQDKKFRAHRSVLCARNGSLSALIQTSAPSRTIEFNGEYSEGFDRILRYFYTGDVHYIVHYPSISLMRCLNFFSMNEMEPFFTRQNFEFRSEVTSDEHIYTWLVVGYDTRDYLHSPLLGERGAAEVWRLHLFPRSTERNSSNMDLFIEYASGENRVDVSVEILILDQNDGTLFETRRSGRIQVSERLTISDFVSRLWLERQLRRNSFRIVCIVRVSKGETISRLTSQNERPDPHVVSIEVFYDGLGLNMDKLLKSNLMYDVGLKAEDKTFPAHKCILAARSRVLARLMREARQSTIKLNTTDIILELLLKYIYSGSVLCEDISHLKRLYEYALVLGIPSLTSVCSQTMKTHLATINVSDILEFAERNDDNDLLNAALEFISLPHDPIEENF